MSSDRMTAVDVYLRITPANRAPWVSAHRAWDSRRFVEAQIKAYGMDAKEPAKVEQIDNATYRKERGQ